MADLHVKWIVPDGADSDRRIDALGGDSFCHTIDDAIYNVRNRVHRYWTVAQGRSVWVVLASRSGRWYLKTETDYYEPNNLLALPHRYWRAA